MYDDGKHLQQATAVSVNNFESRRDDTNGD